MPCIIISNGVLGLVCLTTIAVESGRGTADGAILIRTTDRRISEETAVDLIWRMEMLFVKKKSERIDGSMGVFLVYDKIDDRASARRQRSHLIQ